MQEPRSKSEDKQEKGTKADDVQTNISFAALQDQDEDKDENDISEWDTVNLSHEIQTSLARLKFSKPTPIQSACIPEIVSGHDVVGKASTGSGKTLAFGIPILEYLIKRRSEITGSQSHPIALILSPTRELAHQLSKHISELSNHAPNTNVRIALLTGGLSVYKQQRLLVDANIIIATPGRLWDVISSSQGLIDKLKKIQYLVIDEADRLLSEGHFKELEQVLDALDREEHDETVEPEDVGESEESGIKRQTLVFSATFHKGLQQKLAGRGRSFYGDLLDKKESMEYLLHKLKFREEKPKFIDVNPVSQMADNLKEGLVECAAMEKVRFGYHYTRQRIQTGS